MSNYAPFISSLWNAIEAFPSAQWKTALSQGQLRSKEWLIENSNNVLGTQKFSTAFVIGGWYGLLPALWKQNSLCPIQKFRSIDIDESCWKIADTVNKKWVINDWQFKATTADAYSLNYSHPQLEMIKNNGETLLLHEAPDLVINTCCEHFKDLDSWLERIPQGMNLILQSNNLERDPQHVSCHKSLNEFVQSVNLSEIVFKGELPLEDYTRYMIIGKK